jgi:hypothetical protein
MGKARSLSLERGSIRSSTLVGSSLGSKYESKMDVIGCGKHSSLSQYSNFQLFIVFLVQAPEDVIIKFLRLLLIL